MGSEALEHIDGLYEKHANVLDLTGPAAQAAAKAGTRSKVHVAVVERMIRFDSKSVMRCDARTAVNGGMAAVVKGRRL